MIVLITAELVKPAAEAATADVTSLPVIHESDEHGLLFCSGRHYYI